jgi:hypothetical protein
MQEILDVNTVESTKLISEYIQKYGHMPEHKLEYFKNCADEGKAMFLYESDFGVLCFETTEGEKKVVFTLVEPLSKNVVDDLVKYIKYALFEMKYEKVILETHHEVRLALTKRQDGFRVLPERYHLDWPIFYMKNFDETLSGGKWKKIRYFFNRFFKENKVEISDYKPEYGEAIKTLIHKWAMQRTAGDRTHFKKYLTFVDTDFAGFDMVKIILIDGKPVSIFGGWKIVNSTSYYSCMGIYDYDVPFIGDVSNVLDLTFIKQLGVEKADFGGGEEGLTNYKRKFFPDEFYRTDIYTVLKAE